MKVSFENTREFRPINITITLESLEEAKLLRTLMGRTIGVPDMLYKETLIRVDEIRILKRMMGDIHENISNALK